MGLAWSYDPRSRVYTRQIGPYRCVVRYDRYRWLWLVESEDPECSIDDRAESKEAAFAAATEKAEALLSERG